MEISQSGLVADEYLKVKILGSSIGERERQHWVYTN